MGNKQKRILIVRTDRVGDVILSTPIPREIKKQFPDSFVAVLVRDYTKAIYKNNPNVDLILTDDYDDTNKKETFWKLVKELKKHQFTHALNLRPTERLNWMLFLARIPFRVGVGHKFYQYISFTKSVSRKKYKFLKSEADYCMDLARKIGVKTNNISTEIHLTDDEKEKVKSYRQVFSPNNEFVVGIHTTHGKSTPNISPNGYRKLIKILLFNKNIKIVVTDLEPVNEVKNISEVEYISKSGRDFFCEIAAFDLLISSSTGPSHIAAALKIPTLTFFCTLPACSQKLWSPQGNRAINIEPPQEFCSTKCSQNPQNCFLDNEGGIDLEKIAEKILQLSKNNFSE
ncbi:MAG: glycosyltransferase family 9 protein [Ignavibacteriales bacterium]|nr:glycosyltransferase family 9 protein [Ignavibacteriales bacterium]